MCSSFRITRPVVVNNLFALDLAESTKKPTSIPTSIGMPIMMVTMLVHWRSLHSTLVVLMLVLMRLPESLV